MLMFNLGLQQRRGEMFCRQQRGGVSRRAVGVSFLVPAVEGLH